MRSLLKSSVGTLVFLITAGVIIARADSQADRLLSTSLEQSLGHSSTLAVATNDLPVVDFFDSRVSSFSVTNDFAGFYRRDAGGRNVVEAIQGAGVVRLPGFVVEQPKPAVVHMPEPGTMALLGTGLVGLAALARKRLSANRP